MFVKDAIKHGLSYETGGNQIIRGFNGGISPVDRITECEMRLGPCNNAKKVEFLVTPATTIPIICCPTLSELGIRMDYQGRIIHDEQGNTVRCSTVHCLQTE